MTTKTLTKSVRCASCNEMMHAGEPFRWLKRIRQRPSYALGAGSGMLVPVETYRPQHVHNCYADKVKAQLDQIARDNIEAACEMALKYDQSPEWVAAYRVRLMVEAGLTVETEEAAA